MVLAVAIHFFDLQTMRYFASLDSMCLSSFTPSACESSLHSGDKKHRGVKVCLCTYYRRTHSITIMTAIL